MSLYRHKHIAKYLTTTMCLSVHIQVVPSWDEMVWITNFVGKTNMVVFGWHFCFWVSLQDLAKPCESIVSMAHLNYATIIVCSWVTFLYHSVPSHHSKPWFAYMWHFCFWVPQLSALMVFHSTPQQRYTYLRLSGISVSEWPYKTRQSQVLCWWFRLYSLYCQRKNAGYFLQVNLFLSFSIQI